MPFIEPRSGRIEGADAGDASMWESFTNHIPGYASERARIRRLADAPVSEQLRDFAISAITLGPMALGAGPRPGAFGRAAALEAIPQRDPAVTGGGSGYEPTPPANSSRALVRNSGMRGAEEYAAGQVSPRAPGAPANRNAPIEKQPLSPAERESLTGVVQDPARVAESQRWVDAWNTGSRRGPDPYESAVANQRLASERNRTVEQRRGELSVVDTPRPTVDGVLGILNDLNIRVVRVRKSGQDGTTYIELPEPGHSASSGRTITVRVSADGHVGFPKANEAGPNFYDTGALPTRMEPHPHMQRRIDTVTRNEGGGLYADMDNLRAALAFRYSRELVPPDQAPRGQRHLPPVEQPPPPRPEGPDLSPNQPRLLSVAHPALLWAAFRDRFVDDGMQPEANAGRFAAPIFAPDREMIRNTQELTSRVGRATADMEAEFGLDPAGVTTVAKTPAPKNQDRVGSYAVH